MMVMKGHDTEAPVCSGQALWGCRIEVQAVPLGQVLQNGHLPETTPTPYRACHVSSQLTDAP